MGWQPTPARGFHPEPHNAHALSALMVGCFLLEVSDALDFEK